MVGYPYGAQLGWDMGGIATVLFVVGRAPTRFPYFAPPSHLAHTTPGTHQPARQPQQEKPEPRAMIHAHPRNATRLREHGEAYNTVYRTEYNTKK